MGEEEMEEEDGRGGDGRGDGRGEEKERIGGYGVSKTGFMWVLKKDQRIVGRGERLEEENHNGHRGVL